MFLAKPMPTLGRQRGARRTSISTTSTTTSSPRASRRRDWDDVPERHQEDLRPAGHPRGRAQVPGRGHGAVRIGGGLPLHPRGPGQAGRPLHGHGLGPARAPGHREEVVRQDHPHRGQQVLGAQHRGLVGRLVHLRAQGRQGGHPAAGLLPHQRREHGPVRAHADHRRRGQPVHYIEGCTAPTYSSDSLHSAVVELVALKGAHIRYTTIQNWSTNVFNLVTKRRPRLRGRGGRVGRRQHRARSSP